MYARAGAAGRQNCGGLSWRARSADPLGGGILTVPGLLSATHDHSWAIVARDILEFTDPVTLFGIYSLNAPPKLSRSPAWRIRGEPARHAVGADNAGDGAQAPGARIVDGAISRTGE